MRQKNTQIIKNMKKWIFFEKNYFSSNNHSERPKCICYSLKKSFRLGPIFTAQSPKNVKTLCNFSKRVSPRILLRIRILQFRQFWRFFSLKVKKDFAQKPKEINIVNFSLLKKVFPEFFAGLVLLKKIFRLK